MQKIELVFTCIAGASNCTPRELHRQGCGLLSEPVGPLSGPVGHASRSASLAICGEPFFKANCRNGSGLGQ